MSALYKLVSARLELLKLNVLTGMARASPKYAALSQECVTVLTRQISSVGRMNAEQVGNILRLVADANVLCDVDAHRLRDALNDKLDLSVIGQHNASNTIYQTVPRPEMWLTGDLYAAVSNAPTSLHGGCETKHKKLGLLAGFFGSGGLVHPTEPTCRDITALAMMHDADAEIMQDGLYWVRTFKGLVKTVAKSYEAKFGHARHEFTDPPGLQGDQRTWYDSMYQESVPGTHTPDVVRLAHVRRLLACRSTKHQGDSSTQLMHRRSMLALPPPSDVGRQMPLAFPSPSWHHGPSFPVTGQTPMFYSTPDHAEARPAQVGGYCALLDQSPHQGEQKDTASPDSPPHDTASPCSGEPCRASRCSAGGLQPEAKAKILDSIKKWRAVVGGASVDPPKKAAAPKAKATKAKATKKVSTGKTKAKKAKTTKATEARAMKTTTKKVAAAKTKKIAKKKAAVLKTTASSLVFPGVGKRVPLHYGKSVVYFSPNRYRLMKRMGDRVDKGFEYKACSAREAWRRVAKELKALNPGF